MLKIAIDARPLSDELTGIGRYTFNIIKHIVEDNPTITWYLYSHKPLITKFDLPNVITRTGNINRNSLSSLYAQLIYPIWIKQDKVDTFWSPRHHLPLLLYFSRTTRRVVTIHDIVWRKHPKTMKKSGLIVERLLFPPSIKIAHKIISVSDFTKRELISEFSVDPKKINTTALCSFINPSYKTDSITRAIKEKYLLFVGTLEPRKNLKNTLIAYSFFVKQYPEIKLVIVGKPGWGEDNLNELVKKLNLTDQVELKGYLSDKELYNLYYHCEILLMPSLYEGFGLPALEALSLNRKVIIGKKNGLMGLKGDNIFISECTSYDIYSEIQRAINYVPKNFVKADRNWKELSNETLATLIKKV